MSCQFAKAENQIATMSEVKFRSCTVQSAVKTLYLDEETADVHFVFDSERVPAHKTLLISASKVFRAMFNGQWKEKDVVPIPNVLATDFKAFLQYFYLTEIELSLECVNGVMSLSHQYDIETGFNDCVTLFERNLTVDNVCSTYKLAMFYDHEELKTECEIFISLNTEDVLESSDFLECDRETLSHILRLDKMNCSETVVFYACMDWMNAVTKEDEIGKELVANHLGNVFYDIRFGAMKLKEFHKILTSYESLFSTIDQTEIKKLIRSKIKRWKLFNGNARVNPWENTNEIECNRNSCSEIDEKQVEFTRFSTNKTVLLNAIVCSYALYRRNDSSHSVSDDDYVDYDDCDYDDYDYDHDDVVTSQFTVLEIDPFDDKKQPRLLYYVNTSVEQPQFIENGDDNRIVRFPKPLVIKRGFVYEVRLEPIRKIYATKGIALPGKVKLGSGIKLKFHKGMILNSLQGNLITKLKFGTV